jgi:DNA helicase HerA-like ATPase
LLRNVEQECSQRAYCDSRSVGCGAARCTFGTPIGSTTYVVGQTGTGKTTLLKNLVVYDIEAGRGVGVLDPHGDLVVDLLDHIPLRRADDLVYFDPAELKWPVGFNLLANVHHDARHIMASAIASAFKSI